MLIHNTAGRAWGMDKLLPMIKSTAQVRPRAGLAQAYQSLSTCSMMSTHRLLQCSRTGSAPHVWQFASMRTCQTVGCCAQQCAQAKLLVNHRETEVSLWV